MRNPLHAHGIGSRIKKLNQRLDDIKSRSTSFNFVNLSSYEDHGRKVVSAYPSTIETTGGLDESSLVGEMIEEDTRNLVDMLTKDEQSRDDTPKLWFSLLSELAGLAKPPLPK